MPIRAPKKRRFCDESLCCPLPAPPRLLRDSSSTARDGSLSVDSSSGSAVLPREDNRGNGGVGRGISPRVTDESETGWDSGGQGRHQGWVCKQVGSPFMRALGD
jgi:hypothetical protein